MLSQAIEDYLKAIYKLHDGHAVSTKEIAEALDVSSASVTNMVKRLAGMGFVTHKAYHGVSLTEAGKKIALEIIRHHRLLETYLKEIMGYDWEKMHNEAERLEHHISEEFENRLDEMLDYPTHDPHGDPIPSRAGEVLPISTDPLTVFSEGQTVRIHRLSDSDPALLSRLESLGLLPNVEITLVAKTHDEGPITVMVDFDEHILDYSDARRIYGSLTKPLQDPGLQSSATDETPT